MFGRSCAGRSVVGEVTSGTMSPTLGKSIAMAYVEPDRATEGTALEIDLGGKVRRPRRQVAVLYAFEIALRTRSGRELYRAATGVRIRPR